MNSKVLYQLHKRKMQWLVCTYFIFSPTTSNFTALIF